MRKTAANRLPSFVVCKQDIPKLLILLNEGGVCIELTFFSDFHGLFLLTQLHYILISISPFRSQVSNTRPYDSFIWLSPTYWITIASTFLLHCDLLLPFKPRDLRKAVYIFIQTYSETYHCLKSLESFMRCIEGENGILEVAKVRQSRVE